jgi:TP901 family phage tail tape measure protein
MANGFKLTAELLLQAPTKANVSAVTSELRAMLKDVDVNVNAKVGSTYTKQVKAANTATSELTDVIEYADTTMYKFGHQVGLAAKRFAAFTVSTVGLIELMRAFGTGIKDAVAFQHEMVKIAQVSGKVTSGVKELAAEVTRLSIGLGTQSNKLLEASQILVQAGLSVEDTKTSLEALAKTSISPTFDDIIDTTEGAIAIFSQFKIQAEDLESTLSSVNAVAGKFAVESSDIITTVRRTGGAFKAAGGDLNELIALFTSVRATTRESAESIATGFRTIFTRLQRSRTIEFLDNLGIKLRDTNNQFIGPYKAIEELSRALNGIKGTDPRFSQIIEELGGFRQISKVIPLITEFSEAQKALTVAQLGSKSLAIDAAKAQESLGIQFTKVGERFDALIRKFADTNTFKSLVKVGLSLANAFIDVAESLETVLPLLVTFGAVKLSTLSKFYVPGIGSGLKGESATPARVRRLNSGGRVFDGGIRIPSLEKGTDKIPAMLSKDEFVIKSSSAKKIGYSNLERLNKFGYFSKGGSPSYIPSSGEDVMNTVYKSVDIIVKQIAEKIGLAINPDDIKSMIQRASGSSFRNDAGKPLMSAGAAGQHETLDGSAILLKDTINVFADNIAELGLSTKKIREFLAHEIGHIIDYNSPGERSSNVLDLSPVKSGFSENISTIKYNNATQEQIAKHNEYMLRNSEVFADLFATLVSDIDSQSPKRLQKMKETVVDKGFPSGFDSTIREIVSSRFNAGRMQEFALGEPEPNGFSGYERKYNYRPDLPPLNEDVLSIERGGANPDKDKAYQRRIKDLEKRREQKIRDRRQMFLDRQKEMSGKYNDDTIPYMEVDMGSILQLGKQHALSLGRPTAEFFENVNDRATGYAGRKVYRNFSTPFGKFNRRLGQNDNGTYDANVKTQSEITAEQLENEKKAKKTLRIRSLKDGALVSGPEVEEWQRKNAERANRRQKLPDVENTYELADKINDLTGQKEPDWITELYRQKEQKAKELFLLLERTDTTPRFDTTGYGGFGRGGRGILPPLPVGFDQPPPNEPNRKYKEARYYKINEKSDEMPEKTGRLEKFFNKISSRTIEGDRQDIANKMLLGIGLANFVSNLTELDDSLKQVVQTFTKLGTTFFTINSLSSEFNSLLFHEGKMRRANRLDVRNSTVVDRNDKKIKTIEENIRANKGSVVGYKILEEELMKRDRERSYNTGAGSYVSNIGSPRLTAKEELQQKIDNEVLRRSRLDKNKDRKAYRDSENKQSQLEAVQVRLNSYDKLNKKIEESKQKVEELNKLRVSAVDNKDITRIFNIDSSIANELTSIQNLENEKKKLHENTAKTRAELSKRQDKLEAHLSARQELRAKRERAVATARSQMKAAQLAERFSPAVSLASTLGIAGGDIVSEYAGEDIKNRSSLYLGAQTAQGAAFGGQLGFEAGKIGGATGKIAGVVIGTVGGALYSFLKATEEVSNQLKKISFDKEFKAVSKSFEGIASGADNLSANIGTSLISFNKSFDTYLKTTGDIRQNLKGDLTQLSVPLDTIIKKAIAQSKGDTSAFNALIDQTTIKNFAGITDQNVSDVNRSIYEQLTKAAEDAKKVIVNADAQSVVNAYQASLDNLNNTFNEYIESVNSASNSLSILTDGTVSFAEVSDDVSKMSPQRFSQMVASASRTVQFSGQFGQKIVDRSQQAYEASRVIPYVLREALTSGGLAGNGLDYSIVEYFKGKKNADNTPKYDDQIIAIIQSSVSKTLGAELKPENLAKKLIEDFDGTVKEFREALESASKGLTIFSKFNVENLKQIQEFYQKKKEIDERILELSLKEIDIRESIQDQIAEVTGNSRGRVSDTFNRERAREMLGAFGNLEGNVDAIAAQLAASQQFIEQNEKSVASGAASSDLADRFNREIDKRDAFIKVLDFYTDVTKTAAEAQEKFSAKLNSLKIRQSILDTRVFGTREQKRNQERVLENVRSFAMTANPDSVDESVKQEVFDLLKSIGNASIPELTGNRTAKELLDTARYNDSYTMARSYGADDATARTYADSQVNMANQPDVQQAIIELANAQSTSLNAINTLDTHYNGIRDTILDKLNDILTNFTTNLSAILAREEVRGLQQQQQDTLAKLTGYSQKNATLRNAMSFLGSNSNNPNLVNEESLTKLVASTPQLRKDFETLKTLGNIPLGRDAETFKILTGSVEQFYNQRRQMGIAGGGTGNESPRLSIKEFDSVLETLRTTLASKYDANFAQDIVTQMRQNESLAPVNSFVKAESISSVFEEAFNKVRVGKIAELGEAQKRTNEISSLLGVSSSTLYQYLSSGISKEMTLAFEGTKVSFKAMNDEIVKLNDSLRTINATLNAIPPQSVPRPPIRRQAGGEVPGIGSGDTIPSLLEPGEFVLNRNAVRAVGVGRLTSLNNGISRFQTGGLVGRKINTIEDASAYARDYARETLGIKDGNFSALRGMFTFAYMKPEDAIAAREKIGYIPQAFFRRGEKKIYIQKDKNIDASIMNHEIAHAIDARFGNDSTVASELQGSRIQQFMNNSGYSDIYNRMLDTQEMEYRNTGSMNPSDIDKWKKARSRPAEAFATFMQQDTEARKRLIGELFPAEATSNFNASVTKFSSSAASLATALNSFPRELTLTANHRVEIVITGAQVLQNLLPAVTDLIVTKGKEQINNMLKTKFPTVGLMP